jgi:hypothetical protein
MRKRKYLESLGAVSMWLNYGLDSSDAFVETL